MTRMRSSGIPPAFSSSRSGGTSASSGDARVRAVTAMIAVAPLRRARASRARSRSVGPPRGSRSDRATAGPSSIGSAAADSTTSRSNHGCSTNSISLCPYGTRAIGWPSRGAFIIRTTLGEAGLCPAEAAAAPGVGAPVSEPQRAWERADEVGLARRGSNDLQEPQDDEDDGEHDEQMDPAPAPGRRARQVRSARHATAPEVAEQPEEQQDDDQQLDDPHE